MRLLYYACDYHMHKYPVVMVVLFGHAVMVMPCLSGHMITVPIWYKYHMRVVILVVVMP